MRGSLNCTSFYSRTLPKKRKCSERSTFATNGKDHLLFATRPYLSVLSSRDTALSLNHGAWTRRVRRGSSIPC